MSDNITKTNESAKDAMQADVQNPDTKEQDGSAPAEDAKNGEEEMETLVVEPADDVEKTEEDKGVENGVAKEADEKVEAAAEVEAEADADADAGSDSSDMERRILKQLAYYFGDINLPRDKFLQEQVAMDDGWVPLSVLLTFKRLAAITTAPEAVAAAVNRAGAPLLEVNAERTKVRRNPDMPAPELNDERKKELMGRTAYVKGFPLDATLEVIMQFMERHGSLDAVHMRHYSDKVNKHVFKGSIFAVFRDAADCKQFVELAEVRFGEAPLQRMWQADFIEEKKRERKPHKEKEAAEETEPHGDGGAAAAIPGEEGTGTTQPEPESEQQSQPPTFPKASVVHMSGLTRRATRDHIKKALVQHGHAPAYIAYQKGEQEAWARLNEKDEARALLEKLADGKLKVGGAEVAVRVLDGDEEEQYFREAAESMSKRKNRGGAAKWRGKRRGHGDGGAAGKRARR